MNEDVLATGVAAAGHSGAGPALMLAVLAIPALVAYGVIRWRQRRGRAQQKWNSKDQP